MLTSTVDVVRAEQSGKSKSEGLQEPGESDGGVTHVRKALTTVRPGR